MNAKRLALAVLVTFVISYVLTTLWYTFSLPSSLGTLHYFYLISAHVVFAGVLSLWGSAISANTTQAQFVRIGALLGGLFFFPLHYIHHLSIGQANALSFSNVSLLQLLSLLAIIAIGAFCGLIVGVVYKK